jgi:hypothetical protein
MGTVSLLSRCSARHPNETNDLMGTVSLLSRRRTPELVRRAPDRYAPRSLRARAAATASDDHEGDGDDRGERDRHRHHARVGA